MLEYAPFGPVHVSALAATLTGIVLVVVFRRPLGRPRTNRIVGLVFAAVLLANEVAFQVFEIANVRWAADTSLRLHMCQIAIYVTVYVLITRRQFAFQVAYFWLTSGMLHGLLTPDLEPGDPPYVVMDFFVYHGFTLVGLAFLLATTNLRPTWSGLWATTLFGIGVLPVIGFADYVLDANFWFLCGKPHGDNLTSLLPAWPWYLVTFIPLAIVHYLAAYAPFAIAQRMRRRDLG